MAYMTCLLVNAWRVYIDGTLSLKIRQVCYVSFNFIIAWFVTMKQELYKILSDVEQEFAQRHKSHLVYFFL